jgi:hypothetical protein
MLSSASLYPPARQPAAGTGFWNLGQRIYAGCDAGVERLVRILARAAIYSFEPSPFEVGEHTSPFSVGLPFQGGPDNRQTEGG